MCRDGQMTVVGAVSGNEKLFSGGQSLRLSGSVIVPMLVRGSTSQRAWSALSARHCCCGRWPICRSPVIAGPTVLPRLSSAT